jgi:hypothetical protein
MQGRWRSSADALRAADDAIRRELPVANCYRLKLDRRERY